MPKRDRQITAELYTMTADMTTPVRVFSSFLGDFAVKLGRAGHPAGTPEKDQLALSSAD
jgi:hypothetical protein